MQRRSDHVSSRRPRHHLLDQRVRVDPGWVSSPTHSSASNGHSSMQMPQYMHSDQSMAKRSSTFWVRSRAPDGRPVDRLGMRVNADAPGRAFPRADHAGRAGRFDQPDPADATPLASSRTPPPDPATDRRLGHLRRVRRGLRRIAITPHRRIRNARRHQPTATRRGLASPLAPWLQASSSRYARPALHPYAAAFPRTRG